MRAITFEQAKARYPHRYTMTHVPAWARTKCESNGMFYAPQYRDCREWYENTAFPGDHGRLPGGEIAVCGTDAYSTGQTWPVGRWLPARFTTEARALEQVAIRTAGAKDEARDIRDTVRGLVEDLRDGMGDLAARVVNAKVCELRARHSACMRIVAGGAA